MRSVLCLWMHPCLFASAYACTCTLMHLAATCCTGTAQVLQYPPLACSWVCIAQSATRRSTTCHLNCMPNVRLPFLRNSNSACVESPSIRSQSRQRPADLLRLLCERRLVQARCMQWRPPAWPSTHRCWQAATRSARPSRWGAWLAAEMQAGAARDTSAAACSGMPYHNSLQPHSCTHKRRPLPLVTCAGGAPVNKLYLDPYGNTC